MKYTAVIRTLGTAGEKYQRLLDSLCAQTLKPEAIIVYIAEGYPVPKETCGLERYVHVKKGMVSQRALQYEEVGTEYILFLDDDLYLPADFVERMYVALKEQNADIIAADAFDNASRSLKSELLMTFSGRMKARRGDSKWGYKVIPTAGFSYNKSPGTGPLLSQTNAGACFLCSKGDFLKIRFDEERWLDHTQYAIGEDQVMYYKMYLMGLRQLTLFGSGMEHLDAGGNLANKDKELKLIEGDFFFKTVFWHRFLQEPEKNFFKKLLNKLAIDYFYGFGYAISIIKGEKATLTAKRSGRLRALEFIRSDAYRSLPKIEKMI